MFKWRLGPLVSVALAPLAGIAGTAAVTTMITTPTAAQSGAGSCFTGVDYEQLSLDELEVLVTQAVSQLDSNMSHDDIALEIGRQIGASANGCTPEQIRAVAQNVAVILTNLGIQPSSGTQIAQLVAVGIDPTTASTTVVQDVVILPVDPVYGLPG